jgi:hypothetical protein
MNLLISDLKFIARLPVLLFTLLSPVIITLFLRYLFPFLSVMAGNEPAIAYGRFYSVTAITLISAIPFIYGLLFSFLHIKVSDTAGGERSELAGLSSGELIIKRTAFSAILSFVIVLPAIYLTDPVSTEGWLRGIYATFLISITSPFIFLLATGFSGDRQRWRELSLVSVIFLITVPSGLLLHHPWNYFVFFSPFYWVSWAWVIPSVGESMLYGAIALSIIIGSMLICYRHITRK